MTETKGYFGQFGGSFVPEPIQNLLNQLEETFEQYKNDPEFLLHLNALLNFPQSRVVFRVQNSLSNNVCILQ